MNINRTYLGGNIGIAPELRVTPSGRTVVNFRMATNEVFKDTNGAKVERTTWHSVTAWGKTAENIAKFFRKGDPILVEGRIHTNKWVGSDGEERQRQEVVVDRFHFVGARSGTTAQADEGDSEVPFGADDDESESLPV